VRLDPLAVDAAGFHELVETLRFDFHKWDAWLSGTLRVLPEALLLSRAELDDAIAVCENVSVALGRVTQLLREDRAAQDRLAIPGPVQELIRAEVDWPFQIARYDLIPTDAGWMIPEFNEDAPGGFNEAIAANAVFGPVLAHGQVAGDFAEAFLNAVPAGSRCAMIYATGYAEDLQHMLVLADRLRARGVDCVLASPEQLRCGPFGRPRVEGTPVDWILRFFPGEWYPFIANLRDWRRAVARVPVVNPVGRALRQTKALYALWREHPGVTEADRALLNRYTPHTAWFDPAAVPFLAADREPWVLKKAFGRMGDSVLIGRHCKEEDWRRGLDDAARRPGEYLVQRAFRAHSLPSSAGPAQHPALGIYLVNGRFAGCYSRADEIGFTTHEAHYVVTAVENP
jgi:hypothetical protein